MLKKLSLTALAISLILMLAGCTTQNAQELQMKTTNQQIQQAIQIELNELGLDMSNAAAELSLTGLSGAEARQLDRNAPDHRFPGFDIPGGRQVPGH